MQSHLRVLIAALALAAGALTPSSRVAAQQEAVPPPPADVQAPAETEVQPTFRTGIDFVRVDVLVANDAGSPVTDLTAEDFEVFEDGERQQVESFKLVEVRTVVAPDDPPFSPIRTDADEEREAARDDSRIIAIFLDDYHVRLTNSLRARAALAEFVANDLAPSDLVMLMYPLTPLSELRLTRDHRAVARAIARFEGVKYDYRPRNDIEYRYSMYQPQTIERIRNQVTMSAMKALAIRLGALREGRKAMLFVSEGFTSYVPPQVAIPGGGLSGQVDPTTGPLSSALAFAQVDVLRDLREVNDMANRNNTAIYALDPRGLTGQEFDINENVNGALDRRILSETVDSLRLLAEDTDGQAFVSSNNLTRGLRQMLSDSTTYYLIGYTSSQAPQDGEFHEIDVRVRRRGLNVRARRGYWALTPEEAAMSLAPPKPEPAPAVTEALATLAVGARARVIRTWIGMSPAERGQTRVTFVWERSPTPGGLVEEPARVRLLAAGTNGDPYFRGSVPDTANGPRGAAATEGPWRVTFDADPGTLDLLVTVEGGEAQVLDRDTLEIPVPDLTGPDVRLSTPEVFRARNAREWQTLAADAAAMPVIAREFSRTERLLVRFGVIGGGAPAPAARLLNRGGDRMLDLAVEPAAFGDRLYQVDLPLASLPAGEFLVELTAAEAQELVAIRVGS